MNIVICCDGTGNEFGPRNSNVLKLFSSLDKNQQKQTAYYHPGIGTFGITNPFARLKAALKSILGKVVGYGIRNDVADCYRFLMNNYSGPQDKVFIFGFSRGAYTARILCSLLYEFGLLNRGNENLINYAYKIFNRVESDKLELAKQFKATFSRVCKPYFVGLWDTVSSVGWIYDPTHFPYTYKNPDIKIGRHAISIDEKRCFFRQNLWAKQVKGQSIVQVWFPGVHSDIGGGYPYSESGLSQISLKWMIDHAIRAGLAVDRQKVKNLFQSPNVPPDSNGMLHKSLKGWWWIAEYLPKRHFDFKTKEYHYKVPMGDARFISEGSLIHRSAINRKKYPTNNYNPKNLPIKYTVVD